MARRSSLVGNPKRSLARSSSEASRNANGRSPAGICRLRRSDSGRRIWSRNGAALGPRSLAAGKPEHGWLVTRAGDRVHTLREKASWLLGVSSHSWHEGKRTSVDLALDQTPGPVRIFAGRDIGRAAICGEPTSSFPNCPRRWRQRGKGLHGRSARHGAAQKQGSAGTRNRQRKKRK